MADGCKVRTSIVYTGRCTKHVPPLCFMLDNKSCVLNDQLPNCLFGTLCGFNEYCHAPLVIRMLIVSV